MLHEFMQVNQSRYHFGSKANGTSPFLPDTFWGLQGLSSPDLAPGSPPPPCRSQVNDFVLKVRRAL